MDSEQISPSFFLYDRIVTDGACFEFFFNNSKKLHVHTLVLIDCVFQIWKLFLNRNNHSWEI
jgi:hypothetical protein